MCSVQLPRLILTSQDSEAGSAAKQHGSSSNLLAQSEYLEELAEVEAEEEPEEESEEEKAPSPVAQKRSRKPSAKAVATQDSFKASNEETDVFAKKATKDFRPHPKHSTRTLQQANPFATCCLGHSAQSLSSAPNPTPPSPHAPDCPAVSHTVPQPPQALVPLNKPR
ncbi:TPA: hypothetical protein ACH3X2_008226 [Trebouxia sp. C0005]